MAVTGTRWSGPHADMTDAYAEAAVESGKLRKRKEEPVLRVELCEDGWYVYRLDGKYADPKQHLRPWTLWRLLHCYWLYRQYELMAWDTGAAAMPFGEWFVLYQKEHQVR